MLTTIVRCVLPDWPLLPEDVRRNAALEAITFVDQALRAAPAHIRIVERCFRIALWLWLLPVAHGAPIIRGPDSRVERAVSRFASMAAPLATIVRLYRSLAMLTFLESDGVADSLGHATAHQRQERFRQLRARLEAGG